MDIIKKLTVMLVLATFFLPLMAEEKADSVFEFRFVAKKDMFFSPYQENETELQKLFACVERNRESILAGSLPIYVDGYCNSAASEQACLAVAKTRSNRVKSELIVRKGLSEKNFVTSNHATDGDFVIVRIVLQKEATSEVLEKKPAEEDMELDDLKLDFQASGTLTPDSEPTPFVAESDIRKKASFKAPEIALRANLLRWVTLTPDLGIEWRIVPDWSVLVHGSWTSWSWDNKNRRYGLWEVSPEVRYHIGKEKHGYIGAMYHVGGFNYKLGTTGRQGDLMGGGLTGGYLLKLCNALSLDFSLGFGCTHADFDKYTTIRGVRVKRGHETKNFWGVNHLGVSLVWNIF